MRRFFDTLSSAERQDAEQVALAYANHLWNPHRSRLVGEKKLTRSRYYVGIAADVVGFEALTKRTALVSDTLLLSSDWEGRYHQVARFDANRSHALARYATSDDDSLGGRAYVDRMMQIDHEVDNHPPNTSVSTVRTWRRWDVGSWIRSPCSKRGWSGICPITRR